jgi:hypothetical protein
MEGGQDHKHIAKLKWIADVTAKPGENTRAELVAWFRDSGGKGYVKDSRGNQVSVRVVDANPPYLQTLADDKWTDNLLALPTY